MNSLYQMCPVCTLYLRSGISLEEHLQTHAKEKVISALASLCQTNQSPSPVKYQPIAPYIPAAIPPWQQNRLEVIPGQPFIIANQSNSQSIFYQQIMSSIATHGVQNMVVPQFVALPSTEFNPLDQQHLIATPAIPTLYQQRQEVQIVSTNPLVNSGGNVEIPPNNTIKNTTTTTVVTSTATTASSVDDQSSKSQECILPKIVESLKKSDDEKSTSLTTICLPDITITAGNFSKDQNKSEQIEPKSNDSYGQMEVIPIFHVNDDTKELKVQDDVKSQATETDAIEENSLSIVTYNSEETILPDMVYAEQNKQNSFSVSIVKRESPEEKFIEHNESSDSVIYEGTKANQDAEIKDEKPIKLDTDVRILQERLIFSPPTKFDVKNEQTRPSTSQEIKEMLNGKLEVSSFYTMDLTVDEDAKLSQTSPDRPQKIVLDDDDEEDDDDSSSKNRSKLSSAVNIGELMENSNRSIDNLYESTSRDSLNVRTDEKIPPRGELSEQESNGASEPGWSRTFQEGASSGVSTSFNGSLVARETWEVSDGSDTEVTPETTQNPNPPAIEYPCHLCTESFPCGKLRRVHVKDVHNETVLSPIKNIKIEHTITKVKKPANMKNLTKEEPADIPVENFDNVLLTPKKEETKPNVTVSSVLFSCHFNTFKCNICELRMESKRECIKHFKRSHPGTPIPGYQCVTCYATFTVESKYTEHLRVHPLECPICFKHFYRRINMRIHMKRHADIKPFKCEFCTKSFITRQKLVEHTAGHTGNTPFKCTACHEPFRRQSALLNHRNRFHLGKRKTKDYRCHCGEICHSKKKFLWHSEIHDTKPKSCTYCNEKFVHASSLTRHIRNSHNKTYVPDEKRKEENVQCVICQKICLKHSIDAHMNIHTGIKSFVCNICNKEFTSKWNLKLHRWTHAASTSKPFKCTQCKSAFIRQTDYVAHMNSHKSVRPYTCNHCGRQFIRKYNCQRHVREHEREKSFKCDICQKQFHRSYYLIEHLRIHNGARPYTCHICGKASATKSNHNKHVKIHHAREPISTEN